MVSPRSSLHFLFSLVLPLRCLEVRLEVCPGFFVMYLVVPFVSVVIEQARAIHQRVYCVDDVFVSDFPPSVVCELLYFLDPLH